MFDKTIVSEKYINIDFTVNENKNYYLKNEPFPNIVLDDFFNENFLNEVLKNFPDLSKVNNSQKYRNKDEVKLANNDYENFPIPIKKLFDFMNSSVFLEFLQKITSIKEKLVADPELNGGGLHEIKSGGLLKIHTDFNRHPTLDLDRRVNILIYLNQGSLLIVSKLGCTINYIRRITIFGTIGFRACTPMLVNYMFGR